MKLELNYGCNDEDDPPKIEELSPSRVKKLLQQVLAKDISHR